jgi:hypothetical protein
MTRIIEHRQDAAPGEEVFELRVFQLRDGDVRGCVVPADLAVDLDMMADMSEPMAQAYLDALALCERKALQPYGFTIRSVSFRHASDRSWNCDAHRLSFARRISPGHRRHRMGALQSSRDYRRDGLVARFGADCLICPLPRPPAIRGTSHAHSARASRTRPGLRR